MPELPASKQLRIGRYSASNRIYLLTTNTLDRTPIFQDFRLGRLVVQQFRIAQAQGLATSLAWVVMPDHFHWLISLDKGCLSDLMRQVKSKSTRIINGVAGRQGRLWQPGFHNHAVRREESLEGIARYIVANPLRAGLVKKFGDYPLWDAIWL
jgi:REP element-mobilizing transposase RayT